MLKRPAGSNKKLARVPLTLLQHGNRADLWVRSSIPGIGADVLWHRLVAYAFHRKFATYPPHDEYVAAHKGVSKDEVAASLEAELKCVKSLSRTFVEWAFSIGLSNTKLVRNAVSLMRFTVKLNKFVSENCVEGLHPSVVEGMTNATKQRKVLDS